jgi:hypothetical protein
MDELQTPSPTKQGSHWIIAATCGALVLLVTVGGVIAMRDRLLAEARDEAASQTAAREKLAARIDSLQSNLDALAAAPKPDAETLAALDTKITEMAAKIDALSVRVDELAKAPEPVAPVAVVPPPAPAAVVAPAASPTADVAGAPNITTLKLAVLSGKPFAAELAAWAKQHPEAAKQTFTLATIAESGLMSEADLNRKLRAALDDVTASKRVDDASMAGKLNAHLSGLITIKKSGDVDAYDALRNNVLRDDIASLTLAVEALDDEARKPLEPWLSEARARRDALDALAKLDAGSGH